jgi:hypothetical protein
MGRVESMGERRAIHVSQWRPVLGVPFVVEHAHGLGLVVGCELGTQKFEPCSGPVEWDYVEHYEQHNAEIVAQIWGDTDV